MLKQKNKSKGFTMVEIIVVLAVAGVLAALVTPNILAKITAQKQRVAVEECTQAVAAANQLLSDHTTFDVADFGPAAPNSLETVKKLAGVDGVVRYAEVANRQIVHLCYTRGSDSVMYCRYFDDVTGNEHNHNFQIDCDGSFDDGVAHNELYTFTAGGAGLYVTDPHLYWDDGSNSSFPEEWTTRPTEATESTTETTTKNTENSTEPTTKSPLDPNKDYSSNKSFYDRALEYICNAYNNWRVTKDFGEFTMPSDADEKTQYNQASYYVYKYEGKYYIIQQNALRIKLQHSDVGDLSDYLRDGITPEQLDAALGPNNVIQQSVANCIRNSNGNNVFEFEVNDDTIIQRKTSAEDGTKLVVDSKGVTREPATGDVFYSTSSGNLEVYVGSGSVLNGRVGWFKFGNANVTNPNA